MSDQHFICQVDHLVCRHGALFGYGWALEETVNFLEGSLLLNFESGHSISVRVDVNRERKDICSVYPDIPHAGYSGFVMLAGWRGEGPISGQLQFITSSGATHRYNLKIPSESTNQPLEMLDSWRNHFQRVWRYLRVGNFREIITKARRLQTVGGILRESSSEKLLKLIGGCTARLIVDHSMGGGANLFRDRQIQDWLEYSDDMVILLTFNLYQMKYRLEIQSQGNIERHQVSDFKTIQEVMHQVRLHEVFINCLVSFPELPLLEDAIYDWVRISNAHLIVAIHEYFTICPSHFLLDWRGNYCGIPSDLKECQQCLSRHRDGFVSLTSERSILAWRRIWGKLLTKADEVRCFSNSSLKLITQSYPELKHQLTLTPHRVENLRVPQLPQRRAGGPLRIGVVGSISEHKGALVLERLSRAIEESGLHVDIVILGNLNTNILPHGIIQTGAYRTKDLPDMFEYHRIDLALMPSICPETFSFVTHELITMRVPVACFSLGAQEEAVSRYPLGHILLARDGPGILDELMVFADQIADRF